jgi:DNA primase
MSIFVDHRGIERWTCFATGANGTAIDLVAVATGRSIGDAMAWLAERARLDRAPLDRAPVVRKPPAPPPLRKPSEALKEYVAACERILWQPAGAAVRRWLVEERCLDADVLRHNRIGADPGPRTLKRAKGLPRHGPAAVFPALDTSREPCYLQSRYLCPPPARGKYDNPAAEHGTNPRLTDVEPAISPWPDPVIVTEGVPDALAAASAGYRAVALLGAGVSDQRVAESVGQRARHLVILFDADSAGRSGSRRLEELLRSLDRTAVVIVDPPAADLNTWLIERGPQRLRAQLQLSIALAQAPSRAVARTIG